MSRRLLLTILGALTLLALCTPPASHAGVADDLRRLYLTLSFSNRPQAKIEAAEKVLPAIPELDAIIDRLRDGHKLYPDSLADSADHLILDLYMSADSFPANDLAIQALAMATTDYYTFDIEQMERNEEIFFRTINSGRIADDERRAWLAIYEQYLPGYTLSYSNDIRPLKIVALNDLFFDHDYADPLLGFLLGNQLFPYYCYLDRAKQMQFDRRFDSIIDALTPDPDLRADLRAHAEMQRNMSLLSTNPQSPIYTMRLQRLADNPDINPMIRLMALENLLLYDAFAAGADLRAASLASDIDHIFDSIAVVCDRPVDINRQYYLKFKVDLARNKAVFTSIDVTPDDIIDSYADVCSHYGIKGQRAYHTFITANLIHADAFDPITYQGKLLEAADYLNDSETSARFAAEIFINIATTLFGHGQYEVAHDYLSRIDYNKISPYIRPSLEARANTIIGIVLNGADQHQDALPYLTKALEYYRDAGDPGVSTAIQATITMAVSSLPDHSDADITREVATYNDLRRQLSLPQWQNPFDYYVATLEANTLPYDRAFKLLGQLKTEAIKNGLTQIAAFTSASMANLMRSNNKGKRDEIRNLYDYAAAFYIPSIQLPEAQAFCRGYLAYLYDSGDVNIYNRVLHTVIENVEGTPSEYSPYIIAMLSDCVNRAIGAADIITANNYMGYLWKARNQAFSNAGIDQLGLANVTLTSGPAIMRMALFMQQYINAFPNRPRPEWTDGFIATVADCIDSDIETLLEFFPNDFNTLFYINNAFFLYNELGRHDDANRVADIFRNLNPEAFDNSDIPMQLAQAAKDYPLMARIAEQKLDNYRKNTDFKADFDFANLTALTIPLSTAYLELGRYDDLMNLARWRVDRARDFVNRTYMTLPESQRTALTANNYLSAIDIYSALPYADTPDNRRAAYDGALFFNNLLLQSATSFRTAVYTSADSTAIALYEEILALSARIGHNNANINSGMYASDPDALKKVQEENTSLTHRITLNELSIADRVPRAATLATRRSTRWNDVRRRLGKTDIAIEFISSPTRYGALILRHDDKKGPLFIPLASTTRIAELTAEAETGRLQQAMRKLYRRGPAVGRFHGQELYDSIWAPIEPYLDGITRIYYTPTGQLSTLALHAIENDDATPMSERFDMRLVSTTAHAAPAHYTPIRSLTIFGDVNYDTSPDAPRRNWHRLTGSHSEVMAVDSILSSGGIPVTPHLAELATEQEFRRLSGHSPDCILVSTHGFFCTNDRVTSPTYRPFMINKGLVPDTPDAPYVEISPLKRAGLILADANPAWNNDHPIPDESDGILTAEEIATLDLSDTHLVILSACETAKGETSLSEGVTGLTRAFKLAGVGSIIMTLWEVNDNTTRIFITTFIDAISAGADRHTAFARARSAIRALYPDQPFHWAPFIMLD